MRRLIVLIKNVLSIPYRLLYTHIFPFVILQDAKIDRTAALAAGVKFYRGKIGKYTYINRNSFITDTDIGAFCSIGTRCEIGGASHPIKWVSTSPVFHKWENIMKKNFSRHEFEIFARTFIGNDVWIGSNVMIKAGVTIADGAIIGMGSVVTKNIGPYEIWAGNPARLIRPRFEKDTIQKIEGSKWWDWSDNKIEKLAPYMVDPNRFIRELENE